MADISKIKTPDGTSYNIKDNEARNKKTNEISRPSYLVGVNDPTINPQINDLRANRFAFLPASQIIIEKTTDGGATWVDAGVSDSTKLGLFSEIRSAIYIPRINDQRSTLCGLRVTFTAMKYDVPSGTAETQKYNYWNQTYVLSTERYNQISEMYFWLNSAEDMITVKAERATGGNPNNWVTIFNDSNALLAGWSGNDYIRFSSGVFGGGTTQTGNYWNYRLTFMSAYKAGSSSFTGTSAQSISEIRGYGPSWWTAGNKYAASDHMYSWDAQKNVTFPAKVTATNFVGKNNGFTLGMDVPAGSKLTDTTYSSKTAQSGGTDVSLVTTGEKYTWNNVRQVPAVSSSDNGKVLTVVNGAWDVAAAPSGSELPAVTSSDNGKVLEVINGAWGKGTEKAPTANPVFTGSISLGRQSSTTVGTSSIALGEDVTSSGLHSVATGYSTVASGNQSTAEGSYTTASNDYSHAEGTSTTAEGSASHAEGEMTTASGHASHAEGSYTSTTASNSHAEGSGSYANGTASHAEGGGTANGEFSHAEGRGITYGYGSHAEGNQTEAHGMHSHSEGYFTDAQGDYSHVSGRFNVPDSLSDWSEWVANTPYIVGDKVKRTTTSGQDTVVRGYVCITANSDSTFDSSKWDEDNMMHYAEIVGVGTLDARANGRALDWDGNERLKGNVYVGCNADSTGGTKLEPLPSVTSSDNGKFLCVVNGAWAAQTMTAWQGGSY